MSGRMHSITSRAVFLKLLCAFQLSAAEFWGQNGTQFGNQLQKNPPRLNSGTHFLEFFSPNQHGSRTPWNSSSDAMAHDNFRLSPQEVDVKLASGHASYDDPSPYDDEDGSILDATNTYWSPSSDPASFALAGVRRGNQTLGRNTRAAAQCLLDLGLMTAGLATPGGWAQLMRDASGHAGSGVLDLELDLLGVEEECLDADVPAALAFAPQYCVITFGVPGYHFPEFLKADQMSGLGAAGLCLPNTCSSEDVHAVLNIIPVLEQVVTTRGAQIKGVFCRSQAGAGMNDDGVVSPLPDRAAAGVIGFVSLWLLLVLVATGLDVYWARHVGQSPIDDDEDDNSHAESPAETSRSATPGSSRRSCPGPAVARYHHHHHQHQHQQEGDSSSVSLELDMSQPRSQRGAPTRSFPRDLILADYSEDDASITLAAAAAAVSLSQAGGATARPPGLVGKAPCRHARGILSGRIPSSLELRIASSPSPGFARLRELVRCFSLRRTARLLANTEPGGSDAGRLPGERGLSCLHGIRVLSLAWVFFFQYVLYQQLFVRNAFRMLHDWQGKSLQYAIVGNGALAYETLFALSGLLAGHSHSRLLVRQGGRVNWLSVLASRYWRIVPLMAVVGGCYIAIFPYLTGGSPNTGRAPDEEACRHYGWLNLLLVHNLAPTPCLSWTWFLAVDFQLFLLSPALLSLLPRQPLNPPSPNPRPPAAALLLLATLTLTSCLASGVLSRQLRLPVTDAELRSVPGLGQFNATGGSGGEEVAPDPGLYDRWYLYAPWTHAGAFFPPLVVGYLLHQRDQRCNFRGRTVVSGWISGWIITVATLAAVLFGPAKELVGERAFPQPTLDLYNAVRPTLWGLCVSWVVVACASGHGGPLDALLAWPGFRPLSRLALSTYLVHPVVCQAHSASLRVLPSFDAAWALWNYVGLTACSLALAAALVLALELPLLALPSWLASSLSSCWRRNRF